VPQIRPRCHIATVKTVGGEQDAEMIELFKVCAGVDVAIRETNCRFELAEAAHEDKSHAWHGEEVLYFLQQL
jgi:hypothetical protein